MSRTHFFTFLIVTASTALLSSFEATAQTTIESEKVISPFSADSSYFLGEWILPETIRVFAGDTLISNSFWLFDELEKRWLVKPEFRTRFDEVNSVKIQFKTYPFAIRRTYQNREIRTLDSSFYNSDNDSLSQELINASTQNAFEDSDLDQRGSLSRGIIVGTNQDFALESGLQFELNGQLTDDVSINASLTDKSIPIQPDGTTQNIREFDRVFIQLESRNTTIEMGDVDVSFEQSTFARLNRRLQGAAAGYTNTKYGDYNAALSVVRGTYKSLSFQGQDGVQGPYRLSGRNGEEFVIILAGTERVFINGQRVERGEENDYIIDYGLGEVFFTNNLLIKDETRIVIEYEYIDQNFNRTLVATEAGEEFLGGRFKLGASVIRQADGDELLSQQSLTESDIDVLRGVGDNLDAAIVSGERLADGDDDNNVLYAKIDTTVGSQSYEIFKNIPGSSEAIYIVRFSKVEDGTGSYRRIGSSVNGLLYEWVGPNQGDYEPFRRLPAPEQQQMVALNSSLNLTDNIELYGEWAASSYDQNRFSDLDDGDNNDFSYLSGLRINELNSGLGKISASVQRRYSGERFEYFERTKEVEFNRKWNISRNTQTRESINEANLQIQPGANTTIRGEYGFINRSDFTGYRQGSQLRSNEKSFNLNYTQDWVRTEDEMLNQKGNWFRQKGSLGRELFGRWTPYIGFEQEKKEERSIQTDSLLNTSFSFYEFGPGIQYNSATLNVDASVIYRKEKGIMEDEFRDQSRALEQRLSFTYRPNNYIGTQNKIALRSKDFTEEFEEPGRANRRGLLIRSVTDYETESDFLNGQLFYEANTERRALFQEAYIEVGPELGQYVWIDSNEDGVQQIDEFFPELSPNEGVFVRQFLPSDDLFPVIDLKARFRNEIKLLQFVAEGSGFAKLLSNMQLRSRIDIAENSTTEQLNDVYLLRLNTFRNDSTTVQGRLIWEKELDVLPAIQKADILLGYNESRSLNKRSSESQQLFSSQIYLNSSYHVGERTRLFSDLSTGKNKAASDQLSSRNFDISSATITPGVETTINRSWQTSLSISYASKKDRQPIESVNARILKVINSHRAFLWRKLQANARVEIRNAQVDGSSSSLGAYELTEGTGIGTNLIWSFTGSYRASDLIRISFNYDGRTVQDRPDIHTLKLVVSAVF